MKNIKFLAVIAIVISALTLSACTKPADKNEIMIPSNNETTTENQTSAISESNYTLADVAMHADRNDCWTVIDGKIYDLTSYIASGEHKPIIVDGCGIDSTEMFNNVVKHSGKKSQDMLPGMLIGVLVN